VTTARDYLRFCQMMLNAGELHGTRVLRPETVRQMTTNQLPAEAMPMSLLGISLPGMGFGFGVLVRPGPSSKEGQQPMTAEYGWSGAASTHFWISPRKELIVIILQQVQPYTPRLEFALKPVIYGAIDN
jgi:CubicO group peptidase (beta-lactamase class C family)